MTRLAAAVPAHAAIPEHRLRVVDHLRVAAQHRVRGVGAEHHARPRLDLPVGEERRNAPAPRPGCGMAGRSTLRLQTNADPAKNKWAWQWNVGAVSAADVGDPTSQTDLALCLYDAGGLLIGGSVPHSATSWSATRSGFRYGDPLALRSGVH